MCITKYLVLKTDFDIMWNTCFSIFFLDILVLPLYFPRNPHISSLFPFLIYFADESTIMLPIPMKLILNAYFKKSSLQAVQNESLCLLHNYNNFQDKLNSKITLKQN